MLQNSQKDTVFSLLKEEEKQSDSGEDTSDTEDSLSEDDEQECQGIVSSECSIP